MRLLLATISLFFLQPDTIIIENAWIRNASTGMTTALFFDVVNTGSKADTLTKVSCSAAELVEVHKTFEDGDMMGMRKVNAVEIKAHSTFNFKPMHHHIMLIKLKRDFKDGDKVDVVLHFKQAGEIKLQAPVKKMNMNKMKKKIH